MRRGYDTTVAAWLSAKYWVPWHSCCPHSVEYCRQIVISQIDWLAIAGFFVVEIETVCWGKEFWGSGFYRYMWIFRILREMLNYLLATTLINPKLNNEITNQPMSGIPLAEQLRQVANRTSRGLEVAAHSTFDPISFRDIPISENNFENWYFLMHSMFDCLKLPGKLHPDHITVYIYIYIFYPVFFIVLRQFTYFHLQTNVRNERAPNERSNAIYSERSQHQQNTVFVFVVVLLLTRVYFSSFFSHFFFLIVGVCFFSRPSFISFCAWFRITHRPGAKCLALWNSFLCCIYKYIFVLCVFVGSVHEFVCGGLSVLVPATGISMLLCTSKCMENEWRDASEYSAHIQGCVQWTNGSGRWVFMKNVLRAGLLLIKCGNGWFDGETIKGSTFSII